MIANESIVRITKGRPAIFIVGWDGNLLDNPKDWIEIPEKAMPAVMFIIKEVQTDGKL